MRVDPKHPLSRLVWWALIVVDACLLLLLAAMAIAKPFMVIDQERAFRVDPTYEERAADLMPGSPLMVIVHQFDLDHEQNIAAWVSSLQFSIGGFLALLIYFSFPRKLSFVSTGWLLIGLALFMLSLEETATLHESIGEFRKAILPGGVVAFSWVPIYAIPILAAAVFAIIWLRRAFTGNMRLGRFALWGIACWAGAFLCEAIALYVPHAFYRVEVFFEEGLELAGILLVIYAFAHYQGSLPPQASQEPPD